MTPSIVNRANHAFRQGDYRTAKQLYHQAAGHYGRRLFEVNLTLCERRLGSPAAARTVESQPSKEGTDANAVSLQLSETQKLLEQYYTRCQELEHQLMDR
ncbi:MULTISPECIES: hypothetical protein [Halomonadaceae]|uniref:hypothetical protein n=1 Tax=Halomonadaceae TaxID=28256 RepID=UPI001583AFDE|nr:MULTISPECIES: hypothetical protein [Halomonas]MDI4637443.1 hypothetical protein [Halomonas sp. BMC7]NUJ61277.1 hypothetical protein [Halomonas taeanensis]